MLLRKAFCASIASAFIGFRQAKRDFGSIAWRAISR
jgi:hypothetical protein